MIFLCLKSEMVYQLQTINVSGTKFQIQDELWVKMKKEIPSRYEDELHVIKDEIFVARDSRAFQAILYEQLNGELHIPSDMCPSVFRKELKFWGIDERVLAKCCFVKYITYFEDQEALKILEDDEQRKTEERTNLERMACHQGWRGMQGKMWLILNEPFHSSYSRAYFILHVLLITVSIFALVAGTHQSFQRPLTIAEWKVYFGDEWYKYQHHFYNSISSESETRNTEQDDAALVPAEESTSEPEAEAGAEPEETTQSETLAEPELHDTTVAEAESTSEQNDITTTQPFAQTTVDQEAALIVSTEAEVDSGTAPDSEDSSGVAIEEQTESEQCNENVQGEEETEPLPLPENTRARFTFLDIIEYFSIAFFTLDLLMRVVVCPYRLQLLYSFLHWVDVFALSVMYAKYIFEAMNPKEKYEASVIDILHCLQVVRILQMFRLVESSVAFRVLLYAFKASFTELLHMSLFLCVAMLLFSTCIYFSGDTNFPNIPDAFWWSLITMTTVGYGDMVPKEPLSRLVGVICSITGVCIIAVIIPIFVNNFVLFYSYSKVWATKSEQNNLKQKTKMTQVVAIDTC